MENGQAIPLSPALPSAAPQVIFANWREKLYLLNLVCGLKHTLKRVTHSKVRFRSYSQLALARV
jgi:hypothetical protein